MPASGRPRRLGREPRGRSACGGRRARARRRPLRPTARRRSHARGVPGWLPPGRSPALRFAPTSRGPPREIVVADREVGGADQFVRVVLVAVVWVGCECQPRSRRQHVVPDPQPSSAGKSFQPIPVVSTNTIPASAARSGTGGRPPRPPRRRGRGISGSTSSHSSSVTRRSTVVPLAIDPDHRREQQLHKGPTRADFCNDLLDDLPAPR